MRAAGVAEASETARLAIVTADESALPDVEQHLAPRFETHFLPSAERIVPLLTQAPLDALILDLDTAAGSDTNAGLELLPQLRSMSPDLVLIGLTRSHSRSVRLRAADFVDEFFIAPMDFGELQIVVARAIEKRAIEIEGRRLREQIVRKYSFCDLIGGSEVMQRVYDAIRRVADSPTSVIIRGESGTGKELVARAIVQMSSRRDRPFIGLNCAALPENLIETELFGHERGAFTGAHAARAGHIELAHTGTLFLDEIATLSLDLQTKLLRVLQDRAVQRIGSKTAKKIDFRLITATNQDLEEMVRGGHFREDLYYRIHVIPIFLPPLRERREDIPLLADHFLRIYCAANKVPLKRLDPEALEIFEESPWPGNLREMENLVQRLVLMTENQVIRAQDLPQQILYTSTTRQESLLIPEDGIDFDEEMDRIQTTYLEAAMRRTQGKKTAAAQLLHIDPQRMKYLCRKFKI